MNTAITQICDFLITKNDKGVKFDTAQVDGRKIKTKSQLKNFFVQLFCCITRNDKQLPINSNEKVDSHISALSEPTAYQFDSYSFHDSDNDSPFILLGPKSFDLCSFDANPRVLRPSCVLSYTNGSNLSYYGKNVGWVYDGQRISCEEIDAMIKPSPIVPEESEDQSFFDSSSSSSARKDHMGATSGVCAKNVSYDENQAMITSSSTVPKEFEQESSCNSNSNKARKPKDLRVHFSNTVSMRNLLHDSDIDIVSTYL